VSNNRGGRRGDLEKSCSVRIAGAGRGLSPTSKASFRPSARICSSLSAATIAELERGAGCELQTDLANGQDARDPLVSGAGLQRLRVLRQTDLAVIGQVLGIPDPLVSVHVRNRCTRLRGLRLHSTCSWWERRLCVGRRLTIHGTVQESAPTHTLTASYFPPKRKLWPIWACPAASVSPSRSGTVTWLSSVGCLPTPQA